jgi:alpha-galactosidase
MFFPRKDHDGEETYLFFAGSRMGGRIPDVIGCLATENPELLDGGCDQFPRPSALLMEHSCGLFSRPGLIGYRVRNDRAGSYEGIEAGSGWSTRFTLDDVTELEDGVLTMRASDHDVELELVTEIERMRGGALRIRHTIRNTGTGIYMLERLDVSVPIGSERSEILDFSGRHMNERNPQRHRIQDGDWVREFRRGKPGFDGAVLYVGTPGFGFNTGSVLCLQPAWSGNIEIAVCRGGEDGPTAYAGELLLPGEIQLAEGGSYSTPWVVVSASSHRLDPIMQGLHRWERALPSHPARQPVTLNVWEAVYMAQDRDVLDDIARRAASIGVERYVLDDGWFHLRRADSSGLGDWWVDREVWPDGLDELISLVHSEGMQFGLWFEPEMVNPDSDLFRRHPEWVMQSGVRLPKLQRHQLVLDLTNPEASGYVFDKMSAILSHNAIDYVKWDHNRDLLEAGTNQHGGRAAVHAQTIAYYRLLDRLREAFPHVQWESCASGGGRIDLGVVEHVSRFWTSDMTDALSRQRIQRWTAQSIAPEYLGAHVSAPTSHQSGRTYTLAFRAATAVFFGFGIEWDIRQASTGDLRQLSDWIAWYKKQREFLHNERFFNVDVEDSTVMAYGVAAEDGSRALLAHVQLDEPKHNRGVRVCIPGLVDDAEYSLQWTGPEPAKAASEQFNSFGPLGRRTVTGAYLGTIGIHFPRCNPQTVRLVSVTRRRKETPCA